MVPAWSLVAIGGAAGALARYYLGVWITGRMAGLVASAPLQAPVGTFVINVVGSFLLGVIAMAAVARGEALAPEWRLLLGVGFCGAFTTFSTFSLETWTMLQRGHVWEALAYVGLSNLLGLLAVGLGMLLVRPL